LDPVSIYETKFKNFGLRINGIIGIMIYNEWRILSRSLAAGAVFDIILIPGKDLVINPYSFFKE